jgi:glycosyltransferase involved in cell wall biosynthesis
MSGEALVSIITPFLNAARHFNDTVHSVLNQSYCRWELFLVDDGSEDDSSRMARDWAARDERITYLEHPGHENRGASASRNLGMQHARGEFIAFLDADDIWLPGKLERQVEILRNHPEAAMVYGATKYWYSWAGAGKTTARDTLRSVGSPSDCLIAPPDVLKRILANGALVPCTCAVLFRKDKALSVGNMEDSFPGLFDDQVFYAKLSLHYPVYVSSACDDLYRQHPESMCATASQTPGEVRARKRYLYWVADYLRRQATEDRELWILLARQIWLMGGSNLESRSMRRWNRGRWIRKQFLRMERLMVPIAMQRLIWAGKVKALRAATTLAAQEIA